MYRTGRGSIKMRAIAEIDEGRKGGQRIVVSEVPYQTSVEVIGPKIADLVNDRKIEGIRDVRNESAGDSVRLVVELKRDANAQVVLNQLYKHTPMQTNFAVHLLALVDGVPRLLNLREALRVLPRAPGRGHHAPHRAPAQAEARPRAHRRGPRARARRDRGDHRPDPRLARTPRPRAPALMAKPFEFSEIQANHILDMQLRRLAQLEGQKLRDELAELAKTIAELEAILAERRRKMEVISGELAEVREKFADERRTEITLDTGDIADLDLIEDEEVVVVLSAKGYVKTVASDAFRKQGRGGKGVRGSSLKDEDYVAHLLTTTMHSYLLFFSNRGRVYRLRGARDPDEGAHRARHRDREPARARPRGARRGDHRHAHLRGRRVPVLRDQARPGEEDEDERVRLVAAHRAHRDQPQGGRRARAGDPDHAATPTSSWCRATG